MSSAISPKASFAAKAGIGKIVGPMQNAAERFGEFAIRNGLRRTAFTGPTSAAAESAN